MGGRVIVVGSVNVDLVVTVERLPGPGETVTGGHYEQHHGGKGANAAVAAARLGAEVSFIGAVGRDTFGEEARAALAAEGIDLAGLFTLDESTGVALILVDRDGENSIAVAGGANAALDSVEVRRALKRLAIGPGDVVLVGHEIRTGATHEALRLGRLAGATTILNPAPASGLGRSTIDLADIVTPNRGELEILAGAGTPDGAPGRPVKPAAAARAMLGDGSKRAALVTLGADGAVLVVGRRSTPIRSPSVVAVDTTGAGDTLNGALAAGLAAGLDLPTAAHRAVVAASLAVTRAGAREGMPDAAAVDAVG